MHAVNCSPSGITFLQVHDRMDEYRKARQFSLTRKAEGQPHHRRRRGRHCEDLGPAHAWRQPRHRPQHLRGALGGGDACGVVPPPTRRLGEPLCPFPPCVTDSRRNEASSTWRMPSPPPSPWARGTHTHTRGGTCARSTDAFHIGSWEGDHSSETSTVQLRHGRGMPTSHQVDRSSIRNWWGDSCRPLTEPSDLSPWLRHTITWSLFLLHWFRFRASAGSMKRITRMTSAPRGPTRWQPCELSLGQQQVLLGAESREQFLAITAGGCHPECIRRRMPMHGPADREQGSSPAPITAAAGIQRGGPAGAHLGPGPEAQPGHRPGGQARARPAAPRALAHPRGPPCAGAPRPLSRFHPSAARSRPETTCPSSTSVRSRPPFQVEHHPAANLTRVTVASNAIRKTLHALRLEAACNAGASCHPQPRPDAGLQVSFARSFGARSCRPARALSELGTVSCCVTPAVAPQTTSAHRGLPEAAVGAGCALLSCCGGGGAGAGGGLPVESA